MTLTGAGDFCVVGGAAALDGLVFFAVAGAAEVGGGVEGTLLLFWELFAGCSCFCGALDGCELA